MNRDKWLENVNLENRELEGERIELSAKDALYFLGPNLTLRKCTLIVKVPERRLSTPGVRLIDCTIEVKTELKNFRWLNAHLKGCRFTGALTGNDFGNWPSDLWKGSIEDCDFSEARLDGCRFVGCDASTLRFPSWPYFTLLRHAARLEELRQVPWPAQTGVLVEILADDPPNTAAVTFSATKFASDWGATEDELKAALKHLDGVIY